MRNRPHPSRRFRAAAVPLLAPVLAMLPSCAAGDRAPPAAPAAPESITLTAREALEVGRLVWRNESGGTVDGLTAWNSGENFASMGIGHFIWYPAGVDGPFRESFPELLAFLESRGEELPAILQGRPDCPWPTRDAFQADFDGPRLTAIREFLRRTVPSQAEFLTRRLERSLPEMLAAAPPGDRARIAANFHRVAATPRGLYALIDYVNFKGEGTAASERYRGEGWGLLQVLDAMDVTRPPREAFADAAIAVLTRRVENSPPERNEERWLAGWSNRANTYR